MTPLGIWRSHLEQWATYCVTVSGVQDSNKLLEVRRFRESESHGADSFTLFARSCPGVGVSFLPILLIGKLESESHGVGSFSIFGRSCPGVGVSFLRNRLTSLVPFRSYSFSPARFVLGGNFGGDLANAKFFKRTPQWCRLN